MIQLYQTLASYCKLFIALVSNLDRNLGKTNPLNEVDLAKFLKFQKTKTDSENSWSLNIVDVNTATYDLSVKNPHKKEETALREPSDIIDQMVDLDKESEKIFNHIRELL